MENLIEVIVQECEKCVEEIRSNMASNNINASGRTSASLMVERYDGGVRIVARGQHAPLFTVEKGRSAGKIPYGFHDIIRQWASDKGISFASDGELNRFAYFVSKNIKERGYGRPSRSNHGAEKNNIYTPPLEGLQKSLKGVIFAEVKASIFGKKK